MDKEIKFIQNNVYSKIYKVMKVNLEKDWYRIIDSGNARAEYEMEGEGSFSEWLKRYVVGEKVICEDVDRFYENTNIKVLREYFEKGNDEWAFWYRLKLNSDLAWFVIRMVAYDKNNGDYILFVQYDGLAEAFGKNATDKSQFRYIRSLAKIYLTMHVINLTQDTFFEISTVREVELFKGGSGKATKSMRLIFENNVFDDSLDETLEFVNLNTVAERIGNKGYISKDLYSKFYGWIKAQFVVVSRDANGRADTVLFTTQVIDEEKKKEEQLIRISNNDGLTMLNNRRSYENDLVTIYADNLSDDFIFIMMDINGLKDVNDTMGHQAGDELICGAASCIRETFSKYGKLYRIGGDEFVAIIEYNINHLGRLINSFQQTVDEWKGKIVSKLSLSYGWASVNENPDASIEQLEKLADMRMYENKRSYYISNGTDRRKRKSIEADKIYYEYKGKKYEEISYTTQNLMQYSNIHCFKYFPQDGVWMASDKACEYFNMSKFYDYHPGKQKYLFGIGDNGKENELYLRVINGENTASEVLKSAFEDKYYRVTLSVIEKNKKGNPISIIGIVEDCDERMKFSELAYALSDDYSTVFSVDFERDKINFFRVKSDIIKIDENKNGKYKYEEVMNLYINSIVVEEDREDMRKYTSYDNLSKQLSSKKLYSQTFRIMNNGELEYIRFKAVNLSGGDRLTKIVMGFANISKERREQLETIPYMDSVTGGYGINYCFEKLKNETRNGYLVSLDIRSFKVINTVCGISKGDKILRNVSNIISVAIGDNGYFGHVNADHFLIFLNFENEEDVVKIMDSISAEFVTMVKNDGLPKISPYFGVAKWIPGSRREVIFSAANAAKHRIKNEKDINYGFYQESDNIAAVEEKKMEDDFDEAIDKKQFEIWYQPKYNPEDNSLTGAEALVRWRKEDGTIVPPGKFIPIFEKNGMIRRLDEYVFDNVCRFQKEILENSGFTIPISVNLSRASLYYETIVEDYKKIVSSYDISIECVPIEITESAAIDNKDIELLARKFSENGFRLYIDDFGSGYSSLSTLNEIKFDVIKLDKSLIDYIGEFGGDRLLKHTIAYIKEIGLKVTAEGVENVKQVEFLKEARCDNIQGYYYSKPVEESIFIKKLNEEEVSKESIIE